MRIFVSARIPLSPLPIFLPSGFLLYLSASLILRSASSSLRLSPGRLLKSLFILETSHIPYHRRSVTSTNSSGCVFIPPIYPLSCLMCTQLLLSCSLHFDCFTQSAPSLSQTFTLLKHKCIQIFLNHINVNIMNLMRDCRRKWNTWVRELVGRGVVGDW